MPLLTVAKQLAVLSQEVVLDVHMKACLVEASSQQCKAHARWVSWDIAL